MAFDPPPLISRESPRSRRSRRRSEQQSSCCCLVVVLALLVALIAWRGPILSLFGRGRDAQKQSAASGFPLELTTDARDYLRYNLVRLEATLVDGQGRPTTSPKPPVITVRHAGDVVSTVGDTDALPLRYDRKLNKYVATWPIPWNAPAGEYVAEARLELKDPAAWVWETPEQRKERIRSERRKEKGQEPKISGLGFCAATVRFTVNHRPIATIPPGTCVATWEPDFRPANIERPDGTTGDWKAVFDWCEFMGADTFWFRGAVTEAYQEPMTDEVPFRAYNIQAIPALAAEAHHRGLRFGTWVATYATYPESNNRNKPRYQFAQDVSLGTKTVKSLDFISLLDRKRISHVSSFLAQVQQDPNVDYVGLDYMRADNGGYEMTDHFVREMPVKVPQGFAQWSQTQRWTFMARKIERDWQTDPDFYDMWCWWKAHKVAENLRDIIATSQLKKPLWIFVLSWYHGKQHGQDPLMFSDAGASLQAPMLYQVPNRRHFDTMVRHWNEYTSYGQVNLAPGDQVDFKWHQKTLRPAAPEEMYDRMVAGHQRYLRNGLTVGSFWHDISRAAISGSRGPYPGTEWALAGGAAFTTVRNGWQVYPMTAEMKCPPTGALGGTVRAEVTLKSLCKTEIKRINIKIEKTSGIEAAGAIRTIPSLGAGQTLTVPVPVRLKGPNGARGNRFMVCARVTWPDGEYGKAVRRDLPRTMLVMKYVQGQ